MLSWLVIESDGKYACQMDFEFQQTKKRESGGLSFSFCMRELMPKAMV